MVIENNYLCYYIAVTTLISSIEISKLKAQENEFFNTGLGAQYSMLKKKCSIFTPIDTGKLPGGTFT